MDAITEHLREFNHQYLSTKADRRQLAKTVLGFLLTGLLIIATGVLLWAL